MAKIINQVTLWIFLGFWPVFLFWEIVLLLMRGAGWSELPGLISMVARDRGWSLSAVVYLWTGLPAHFWWHSDKPATVIGSIVFWLIPVALLVQDVALWRTNMQDWSTFLMWQRWPVLWMVAGVLAGRFLFPQVGVTPWSR